MDKVRDLFTIGNSLFLFDDNVSLSSVNSW